MYAPLECFQGIYTPVVTDVAIAGKPPYIHVPQTNTKWYQICALHTKIQTNKRNSHLSTGKSGAYM